VSREHNKKVRMSVEEERLCGKGFNVGIINGRVL
jgi:hypothetical protein